MSGGLRGTGFGRLWAANVVSNVGDGVTLAAGPLLVASLTDNPVLVSLAVFAQQLPWLLFSLISGAYVDRLDRRLLVTVVDSLRGPPIGAWLFVVATAVPFGLDAVSFVLAAALIATLPRAAGAPPETDRAGLRTEIAEGVRWLWQHRVLRMLALSLCLMNITFDGVLAIFVLWSRQRLGFGPLGYGLLLSCSAVGGVLGSVLASRLERRFGVSTLLRIGLLIETTTHLVLALTRTAWVGCVAVGVFGVHAVVWSTVTMSLRQRVVPDQLRGRVNSVYYCAG